MSSPAISDSLAPIRNRFLSMLLDRQNAIQSDLELALGQPDRAFDALGRIEAELHKIAGTAGTLGFVALGEGARAAEIAIVEDRNTASTPTSALYLKIIDVLELTMEITCQDADPQFA